MGTFGLLAMLVGILGFSFYFWPKDERTLRTVIVTAGVFSGVIGLGIVIARALPVTHKTVEVKKVQTKYVKPPQIVYRDKPVFVTPGKEYQAVDTEKACSGGVTLELDQVTTSKNDDKVDTWILGHPLGSHVQVT